MKKALGVLAATLVTPAAIAVAFVVMTVLNISWFVGKPWRLVFGGVQLYSAFAAPIALVITLMAGVPLGNRMATRGRARAAIFLMLGALLGAMPFAMFDAYVIAEALLASLRHGMSDSFWGFAPTLQRLFRDMPIALYLLLLGSWCGMCSSFAYWLLVYRGSPSNYGVQPSAGRTSGATSLAAQARRG